MKAEALPMRCGEWTGPFARKLAPMAFGASCRAVLTPSSLWA
ncbi:hypothetical protein EC915_103415 [Pseudomonas sp. LP_7_YM]|nr:hypothetical protein EC915_103415 [Pseudomonas sp. LP_7_YM]